MNNCDAIKPPISVEQADELLKNDLLMIEACVDKFVKGLNENQFSAVVSLTFNLGCTKFQHSSMRRLLKQKQYMNASHEFRKWSQLGETSEPEFVKRRKLEKILFCKSGCENHPRE